MNVMLALAKTPHTHTTVDFFDRHMFSAEMEVFSRDARRPSYRVWMNMANWRGCHDDPNYDPAPYTPTLDRIGYFTKELWI